MLDARAWRRLDPRSVAAGRRSGLIVTALIAVVSLAGTGIGLVLDDSPGVAKLLIVLGWLTSVGVLTWLSLAAPRWRYGLKLHAWLARHPPLYHVLTGAVIRLLHLLGRRRGSFAHLPFARGWTSQRHFPAPQQRTFMQMYQMQMKSRDEQ